ncbi:hypothetical protein M3649_03545 [Ureibacillus chungkukjangi]|uniref:hypothetical protein n=1 Tax=Ureibacillus chungkukjangi TaxID=1202712 RepID=UPI00203EF5E9|nr:hypothetical protein [Ureibacillus chungkukjangi]MCM3387204.1 hypothetical protein [Ureibacillus chungkukjangi]
MTKFYFEFNKHEYYGLVVSEANTYGEALEKSYQIYQSTVAGDSILDVTSEGKPDSINEKDALLKFLQGCENENAQDLMNEFNYTTDTALLVDGTLL